MPEVLRGDISCTGCKYDLRGLSMAGRCPECGMTIRESYEKQLAFEDRMKRCNVLAWRFVSISAVVYLSIRAALLGGMFVAESSSAWSFWQATILAIPVLIAGGTLIAYLPKYWRKPVPAITYFVFMAVWVFVEIRINLYLMSFAG